MRLYHDEVVDFWREGPARRGSSRAAGCRACSGARCLERVGREEAGGAACSQDDRARVRDRPLCARAPPGLLRRARALLGALRSCSIGYNTLAAMVFAGTARYRTPWDFLLAILAAFALAARVGACPPSAAPPTGRRRQSALVERLDPRDTALRGELVDARGERRLPSRRHLQGRRRARRSRPRGPRHQRAGRRCRSPRRRRSRKPADRARDHRPRALHRLERDHAEALPERRDDDDRGALDRLLHRRHEAEKSDGILSPSSRAYALSAGASGPRPATSSVTPAPDRVPARARAAARGGP